MSLSMNHTGRALLLVLFCTAVMACSSPEMVGEPAPTPTPDIALLEASVAADLAARFTAVAPTPTATLQPTVPPPTPVPTLMPTSTPTPIPSVAPPSLVHVRRQANGVSNIVVPGWADGEAVLTHFGDPTGIYSLAWSKDGQRIAFVCSHNLIQSRSNERNIFVMRADGAELAMVTGDYMAPEEAPGPYVTLSGRVEGAPGICQVAAQGMGTFAQTDESNQFVLEGVSASATWARAVCQGETNSFQGSIDLALQNGSTDVVIAVSPRGEGWRDVRLAPDGQRFVGTRYQWSLDEQGAVVFEVQGVIRDLKGNDLAMLQVPEGHKFHGADWSNDGERIVGGLSDDKGASLWQWDPQGNSIGELYRIPNNEDQIFSFERPVWSPDGQSIAFELHRWYWWSGEKFRTDLMAVSADGLTPLNVQEMDWGWHATHISWGSDSQSLFYQYYASDMDLSDLIPNEANIRSVPLDVAVATAWTEDGSSYLPALRPVVQAP